MQQSSWYLLDRKVTLCLSNTAGVSHPSRMYPLASGWNALMLCAPTLPRYAKGLRGALVSAAKGASQGSGMWQKARERLADQEMREDDETSWILMENDKQRTGSWQLISSRLLGGCLRRATWSQHYYRHQSPSIANLLDLPGFNWFLWGPFPRGDSSERRLDAPVRQKHLSGAATTCVKCQGN